jgi:hypothetical protein
MVDYSCKHIIQCYPSIVGVSSYQEHNGDVSYGVRSNLPFGHQSIIPSLRPISSHFVDQALQAVIHLLRGLIIKHHKSIKLAPQASQSWPSARAWYLHEILGVFPTSH